MVGLGVGLLSGLTGVGGGIVLVPASTLLFGLTQHQAQGVSLAVIVPTSIIGAYSHWRMGNTEPRIAFAIGSAAIFAGAAGAFIAQSIPPEVLAASFGLLMLFVGQRYIGFEGWIVAKVRRN